MANRMDKISRVAHEANRALCTAYYDLSQKSWDEASPDDRQSTYEAVLFRIRYPEAPVSHQHEQWMAQKIANGWTYGEVKDATKKTHPCLVPFEQLPPDQQAKDALFAAIVTTLSLYVT